jgi:hypothetical protein
MGGEESRGGKAREGKGRRRKEGEGERGVIAHQTQKPNSAYEFRFRNN